MAARTLFQNIKHFVPDLTVIVGHATGAGANPLTDFDAPGVHSIVEYATGYYTITLTDQWNRVLHFDGSVWDTATIPDDWEVVPLNEDVAATKTINILVFKGGVLADLTTDQKLSFSIWVSNSSRKR